MNRTASIPAEIVSRANQADLRRTDFSAGCLMPVFKPVGWTSFDVVNKLKKLLRNPDGSRLKKIGHAGTLDPFATGLLLICTGKATKLSASLMQLRKEYRGEMRLGQTTDTLDVTGKVLSESAVPDATAEELADKLSTFSGEIDQIPPMFSAVKVGGQRLYKLARQGKSLERKPRKVFIHEIELLDVNLPRVGFRVVCSKGTYIRAIAGDFGEMLGCGAYLERLVRTRIGDYHCDEALRLDMVEEEFSNLKDGNRGE